MEGILKHEDPANRRILSSNKKRMRFQNSKMRKNQFIGVHLDHASRNV